MYTCHSCSSGHARRPRWPVTLAVCVLIAASLLPNGAGWAVQAAPAAQENPASRLPYDGLVELPRLEGAAPQVEVGPTLSGPEYVNWSKLVFQSARNNHDWEIYSARGDGSEQVNISNHSSMDIYPRLNRGATRVVFASNRHGNYEIFAMNADGSGQTRLTSANGNDMLPAWSPDGSRIAFQAYRDGQAEIYVMNADGSGQTRLTNHGDYDGEPAWSPDGSQIAFVRRASDQYRVWVMNADGSSPRQLSNQAYSENPAWSPDGSQIAYDCDGNGDGWQEIWLMNADGSNQRQVYDPPEYTTDAWVGSWSPDGRYVAFTRISWTYYQGNWYWTTAYLDAWDSTQTWNTITLSSSGADWIPRWESTDARAPTSSVHPLAAQSPGPFTVAWSGSDVGGSELKNFDVQVKDGAGGAWSNWKIATGDTSGSYPGVGGHTYFFRSRARDNAANVEAWPSTHDAATAVEALAPQTAVQALPAFSRNGLVVRWGGADPGGSGIQSYDVQVRAGGGAWTDWRMGVSETSAIFDGTAGVEYRFRARARDRAQNLEAWPPTADTSTTLYTWAVAGQASDNRGAPVVGMATTMTPAAFHTAPSDHDGAYAAHVAAEAASYSASWSKAGYGALPGAAFLPNPDAAVDVVLPPADNVVQNWGFESGNASWQFGGSLQAMVKEGEMHSGSSSAFLGSPVTPLQSVIMLPYSASYPDRWYSTALDPTGTIHAVWDGPENRILYSAKPAGGLWTAPETIPSNLTNPRGPQLLVGPSGKAYVLWSNVGVLYLSERHPNGIWSDPTGIPGTDSVAQRDLAFGEGEVIKVIWCGRGGAKYSVRSSDGTWSTSSGSIPIHCSDKIQIATDPSGLAHVLSRSHTSTSGNAMDVFYTAETTAGIWSSAINLSETERNRDISDATMEIDAQGRVYVVWDGNGVFYRVRSSNGSWSPKQHIGSTSYARASIIADNVGDIHLAWTSCLDANLVYARQTNGVWSVPAVIASYSPLAGCAVPRIRTDGNRTVHILWQEEYWDGTTSVHNLHYSSQDARGRWIPPITVHEGGQSNISQINLLVDHSGTPHALWIVQAGGSYPVWYAGPDTAPGASNAWMEQTVQVPAAANVPTLSCMIRFTVGYLSNSRVETIVDDGITSTTVYSSSTSTGGWSHHWANLTPWAGRSVTLRFRVIEEAGGSRAGAYIDEVTVGSAHPDIWVGQPAWQAAPPGRTFGTTVTYGNRGGVAASGGQVTLQLPAELSFVSADPPPSATTPTPRWDVGALPAQSGPQTIRVTLQVAASAAGGSTVNTTARITSSTTELEQANNTAPGSIYIGSVGYLPVIMR